MNQEIWNQLLSLESRDITQQWFTTIHSRQLNARRAREINASAKQAREYFRNASRATFSVRPLLTFYGVASLSRALLLLLKADGGEECLAKGHGLETVGWAEVMSGDTSTGLQHLLELRIRTTNGVFSDFVQQTNNTVSMHISSSAVDWSFSYEIPGKGSEFSVLELFSRIPDLREDFAKVSDSFKYVPISEMTFSDKNGFRAKLRAKGFDVLRNRYETLGYKVVCDGGYCTLTCDTKQFLKERPMFIHSYINKQFSTIPILYLTEPFPCGARYSQLCITYMVSYILGMLVRYYPTHWISLIQGEKGDSMWPTINRAQHFVEISYPEVVIELLLDLLKNKERVTSRDGGETSTT